MSVLLLLSLVDNDRISREYKSLKDLYERLQQSFNEEQSHIQQQIHTFTEQLHEKIAGYEQEKIKRIEVQEQNSELRMIIDKYRAQVNAIAIAMHSITDAYYYMCIVAYGCCDFRWRILDCHYLLKRKSMNKNIPY